MFQDDWETEQVSNKLPAEERPRILIATSGVLGVGLNLTRANKLIKFDFAHLASNDRQTLKRTHRIGQRLDCSVWRLCQRDNEEEKNCRLRQEHREAFQVSSYGARVNDEPDKISSDEEEEPKTHDIPDFADAV